MGGVGDEGAPVPGDALETANRFDRKPREDLDDKVVGEVGGGVAALLGALNPWAGQSGMAN